MVATPSWGKCTPNIGGHVMIRSFVFCRFVFCLALGFGFSLWNGTQSSAELTSTQVGYDAVQKLEIEIERIQREIREDGFSSRGFYEKIVAPLNKGESFNFDYLKLWESRNVQLHQARYTLIEKKQHAFIVLTHVSLDALVNEHPSKKFLRKFERLDEIFRRWADASDAVGEGLDPKTQRERMYAFYDYFKGARELLEDLKLAPDFKPIQGSSRLRKFQGVVGAGLSGSYIATQLFVRSLYTGVKYLNPFRYILPRSWKTKIRQKLLRNTTPLTSELGMPAAFKSLAAMKGYRVHVRGQEILKSLPLQIEPGKKTVNLFLPSHRSDVVDAMVMAHLNLPHFLVFANPSAFVPGIVLGTMVANLPEFISVGKWRGFGSPTPTDKLISALEAQRSPNVINYPQGFVANAGEILPINASFVEKLLYPLVTRGYDVNIIPISYEIDSHLLSQSGEVDSTEVFATIHPPLTPNAVKTLVEHQMKTAQSDTPARYIDHFLSTLWYENIRDNKELGLNELMRRAEENLGLKFNPEWVKPTLFSSTHSGYPQ